MAEVYTEPTPSAFGANPADPLGHGLKVEGKQVPRKKENINVIRACCFK